MNHKILIAASVCLSLFAAAQSQTDKQKPKPAPASTVSPRDASSGQSSGRVEHLEQKGVIHRDLATRDAASSQALGNKSAQDHWDQTAVSTTTPAVVKPVSSSSDTKAQPRVAVGDVNGDGVADAAASKNSAHATEAATSSAAGASPAQAPRDAATGQASGKRMHKPVVITKESDKSPNH